MCRVIVETPVKLSSQQKEMLREFEGGIEKERLLSAWSEARIGVLIDRCSKTKRSDCRKHGYQGGCKSCW